MDSRHLNLVQSSSTLQIGEGGNTLNQNGSMLEIKDATNSNYGSLTTGDLTVKGNFTVETGHVTEFDVGTAIFQDKVIELGASDFPYEGMADKSGIKAVNGYEVDPEILVEMQESTVTISGSSFLNSRQLVLEISDVRVELNIQKANSLESLLQILLESTNFTSVCSASISEGKLKITSKSGQSFTRAEINRYSGYSITFNNSEGGWDVEGFYEGENNENIPCTVTYTPRSFSTSEVGGYYMNVSTITVPESYTCSSENSLVTRKFLTDNTSTFRVPDAGLGKGIYFSGEGEVTANLTTSPMGGLPFGHEYNWTVVCPWVNLSCLSDKDYFSIMNFSNSDNSKYFIIGVEKKLVEGELNFNLVLKSNTLTEDFIIPIINVGEKDWIQPIISVEGNPNKDESLILFVYNNYTNLGMFDFPPLNLDLATNLYLGTDKLDNSYYEGNMVGELIVYYDTIFPGEVEVNIASNQWINYPFESNVPRLTSGELKRGKSYTIEVLSDGDFTACGLDNSIIGEPQLCKTTATPNWGTSALVSQSGALLHWILKPTKDPNIDVLDVSHGTNGTFNGLVFHNDTFPDNISIEYI